jgi:hypothetical protein
VGLLVGKVYLCFRFVWLELIGGLSAFRRMVVGRVSMSVVETRGMQGIRLEGCWVVFPRYKILLRHDIKGKLEIHKAMILNKLIRKYVRRAFRQETPLARKRCLLDPAEQRLYPLAPPDPQSVYSQKVKIHLVINLLHP